MTSAQRSLERALDLAAQLVAYSRADLRDEFPETDLSKRLEEAMHDVVHEFAFHARKAVERCAAGGVFVKSVYTIPIHSTPVTATVSTGETFELTSQSLWWVLNRLTHSVSFEVMTELVSISERRDSLVFTKLRVGSHRVLSFASDRDEGAPNYVDLEALVRCFVTQVVPILTVGQPPTP